MALPQKVEPGQPLDYPAEFFNVQIDVAQSFLSKTGATAAGFQRQRDPDVVKVKNASGADVDRFGVLEVTGVVFTPTDNEDEFKNNFALTGGTPSTNLENFVVLLEPIPDGKFGRAIISGVTPVKIDVVDADHQFARAKSASAAELESGRGPARIIWKESGTGSKWSLVRLGDSGTEFVLCKPQADIAAGGSGLCVVWQNATTPTTETISLVHDWMGSDTKISMGKRVIAVNFGGVWRPLAADCE